MFEDLNQCLGWKAGTLPPDKGLLLISSEGTDGGFLLHHFISFFLKHKRPICVVTLAQTFSHYAQAGTRIGANLDKAKTDGIISHIDLMSAYARSYLNNDDKVENAEVQWTARHIFLEIKSEIEKILSKSQENLGPGKGLIVFDDISILCGLGMALEEVGDLLHYLTVYSKSSGLLFVTVIPTFIDDACSHLQTYAIHSAGAVIQVKALPSGYSKDVHGHLCILKTSSIDATWQYKLSDKSLSLFAKGTSSAVL